MGVGGSTARGIRRSARRWSSRACAFRAPAAATEALAALAEARAIYEPLDHPELGSVDNYTGLALTDLGRFAEAERAFEHAAARFSKNLGADSILAVNALANEAYTVSEQGRIVEAQAMFERAIAALRVLGEFDNPRLLRSRFSWGANLRKLGRFREARTVLEEAGSSPAPSSTPVTCASPRAEVELARLELAEGGSGAADAPASGSPPPKRSLRRRPPAPSSPAISPLRGPSSRPRRGHG